MSSWRDRGRTRLAGIALVAGALLSACGFQMRGAFALPAELVPVYIDADRGSEVGGQLRQLLRRNNVAIAEDRKAAASVIEIAGEERQRRVLTVSAATADVDEFELRYTTRWLLRDSGEDRRALTNLETVETIRDYTFDREAVLAKQSEEAELLERMQEDTALRILYRIQAWSPNMVPESADVEAQMEKQRND